MKASERSFQFKKNYLSHFQEKMSVAELAVMYGLNRSYCYSLIRALASEMGVDYYSIIYQPHKEQDWPAARKNISRVKPIDVSEFQKQYREAISSMDKANNAMKAMLKNWPEAEELVEEQEEER